MEKQNSFRINRSANSRILIICQILEGVRVKNLEATQLFVNFSNAFDFINRGKMEEKLITYGLLKETVTTLMMHYLNTKAMIRSSDGDTDFFDILDGVLQGEAAVVSILLYRCTTWTLTKRMEKKLDGNYTRMLRAILNKSWWQYPTKNQLYGYLPPITKTIKIRRTRHEGHYRRSRDELISDVLLWIPAHGQAKAGWPARTYIQQLWGYGM